MKNTRKAILLSALVLPGLGQITLKRYKMGIAIMVITAISAYRMLSIAMGQANAIVNKMLTQGGVLDLTSIANATAQATGSSGNPSYQLYLWVIIACWVISIVDAWQAGKKLNGLPHH